MNGEMLLGLDRAAFVHRLADDVHDAPENLRTNRHLDGVAGIDHFLAAHRAVGGVHGDGAHGLFTQMLGHFENQPPAFDLGFQGVENGGEFPLKLHVHHGTHDLGNLADVVLSHLIYSHRTC